MVRCIQTNRAPFAKPVNLNQFTPGLGSGKNGKVKMHELYLTWLSCKGDWGKCKLVVKGKQSRFTKHEEKYDFLTKDGLIKELGNEDLAKDLIERHEKAEQKLPAKEKGQFIRVYLGLNF